MWRWLIWGVLCVAARALGAPPCMDVDARGTWNPKGQCAIDQEGSYFALTTNTFGGLTGIPAHPPLTQVLDGGGLPVVASVPYPSQFECDATMQAALVSSDIVSCGRAPTDRPVYTTLEGMAMGFCTNDQACGPITGLYNFTTQPELNGAPMGGGSARDFTATGYVLNAGKQYAAIGGGATTGTRANVAWKAAAPCNVVAIGLVSAQSGVPTVLPAGNNLTVGISVNGTDTGTLCTLNAAASSVVCTGITPTTWAAGDVPNVWQQGSGSSSATFDLRWEIGCS